MAVTTNNAYLSNYTRDILNDWLGMDTPFSWPASPTQWWFGLLSSNSAETEVSYTGYARRETTVDSITTPSGSHVQVDFGAASAAFPAFVGSVDVTGVGIWDASTGGNLLAYVVFGNTYADGDIIDLSSVSGAGVTLNFSSSTAGANKKANPIALPILATCAWMVNATGSVNNVNGIPISEILAVTDKGLRSVKIIDNVTGDGAVWDYPTGGEASYGNGTTDHAIAVEPSGGIVVRSIPSVYPSGASQLCVTTSIDSSTTRWVNAVFGIPTSGRITAIEYGTWMRANPGSPPPAYTEGEYDAADANNIWVKLARWNLTGSNGSFSAPTSKMAFTLGLCTNGFNYIPNPTYGGSLTGISLIDPLQTTQESGYPYEHELCAGRDSTVTYEVTSIYSDAEFQYYEASAQEIPVDVQATDANIEIVEMRRYTADVRSGDSAIAFSMKLRTQDNDIPSLSGKDIRVRYSVNGGPTEDVWASTPSDYTTDGRVIFGLPPSAFETAGQVRLEIAIIGPGGSVQTLPFDDTVFIGVMDSL